MKTFLINSVKKALQSSKFCFWSWIVASLVSPIVIVGFKYDLFSEETSTTLKVSIVVIVLTIFAIIRGWNVIREWASELPEGFIREVILASMNIVPFLFLWIVGAIALNITEDFLFVAKVLFFTQITGILFRARNRQLKRAELSGRGYVNVLRS